MYFASEAEQTLYCDFLGISVRQRTPSQQVLFDKGWIQRSGFVPPATRIFKRYVFGDYQQCTFMQCPVGLIRGILQLRQHSSQTSHVASVLRSTRAHVEPSHITAVTVVTSETIIEGMRPGCSMQ